MSTYQFEQNVQKESKRRHSGIKSNQIFKDVKEGLLNFPVLKIKNRCNYDKLKHYLKLSSKALETERLAKADLILKYRNEVVNHIRKKEIDHAMLAVVQILKQAQLKEAMLKCVTYCDVLLDRFSLLQTVKSLDDISAEAVSSLIWASQRMTLEELRTVADQLSNKYGRCYAQACTKKQVATINEQLVSQISVSAPSQDVIYKMLIDITEEYKIEYKPETKAISTQNVNKSKNLMDLLDDNFASEKENGLLKVVPLISPSTPTVQSSTPSQLFIPSVGCKNSSPGGSCIAKSPGGSKTWCNFDISPVKDNMENIDPASLAVNKGASLHKEKYDWWTDSNVLQSSSALHHDCDTTRKNPFLDDLQGMNLYSSDVSLPPITVTNPFKDMLFQDDSKAVGTYEHDLFQVDSPINESGSWKTKTVDSDLLFEMDLEEGEVMC